ncbi:hypothetical protein GCM10008959_32920 [Deinococcus seoulensis]|uniref:Uncharacterized protein n=1 Tax=Deinococcus seoulensis TaxID=1837379 RepID=A0ABQ2RY75_9DEIO|nr:hypothetical protein [Deinococcus seoulensis]GGR68247.1 hypothetical protein GCM10008959_32920 [Deinococcus seoulensis]
MINLDDRALSAALARIEQAANDLPAIAERTRAETLGHLIIGANANIYATQPGAYRRTGEYLRSLHATARVTPLTATVTASNDAEYARDIETGETGNLMQLQAQAAARGNPRAAFTLGRSGINWALPGPVITGAQAFAAYRLRELFVLRVRAVR